MSQTKYTDPYKAARVDFLINYEHKAREIESICLIKNELERRGYSVGLSNTYHEQRVSFAERRRATVVIAPALYNDACLFAFVYRLAGACRKVVNMQWEQALTNQDESDPGFYQNPKGAARNAVHLCWGEEPRLRLLRAGVPPDKAIVVGPVQMDILRAEMNQFHMSKGEIGGLFGLPSDRDWVLFISSFTFTNMSAEEFATELRCVGPWLNAFRSISIASQEEIVDWMITACARYPNKIFIYRPHPSETPHPKLAALATQVDNFRVIKEHSVRQWIRCCDRIFTWYSTAAAEVFVAGKACSVLRPVGIPIALDVSIFRKAAMVECLDQFLQCLTDPRSTFALNSDLIHRYFEVDPATPAYVKICDLLERIHDSSTYDMPEIGMARSLYFYLQWIRHRTFFVLKDLVVRTRPNSLVRTILIRTIGVVRDKIDNHEALMRRMDADREKNFATVRELERMNAAINEIRYGNPTRTYQVR